MTNDDEDVQVYTFDSYDEAVEAARKMRSSSDVEGGVIARVSRSPYGGFRVLALPAEVYADLIADGVNLPSIGGIYNNLKMPA